MSNNVGMACPTCRYFVDNGFGAICVYGGQCYGTQTPNPTDTETRRTGRIWGVNGKIDGQGRLHLPRKFAKQIDVEFGDTVHIEKRDGEEFIRIYKAE